MMVLREKNGNAKSYVTRSSYGNLNIFKFTHNAVGFIYKYCFKVSYVSSSPIDSTNDLTSFVS